MFNTVFPHRDTFGFGAYPISSKKQKTADMLIELFVIDKALLVLSRSKTQVLLSS